MNLFVPLSFLAWRFILDFFALITSSTGWRIEKWANWDGGHYLTIAQSGYKEFYQTAFFPLYPFIIKLFSLAVDKNLLISGFIISNAAFLLGLYVFYTFVSELYGRSVARRTVFYLLIFPTSFFFGSIYSESTFFLLTALTFLFAYRKQWTMSAISGFLASLTRFSGIFLFVFLIIHYFSINKFSVDNVKRSLIFLLVPLGLGIYSVYQWYAFGSPISFILAQQHWQRTFIPFWDTLSLYISNLSHFTNSNYFSTLSIIELMITVIFLTLSIVAFFRLPTSLAVFGLLSIIPPLFASNFASMPRYVLSLLPVFILLGRWGKNIFIHIGISMLIASFFIQFLLSFLYGFWLA